MAIPRERLYLPVDRTCERGGGVRVRIDVGAFLWGSRSGGRSSGERRSRALPKGTTVHGISERVLDGDIVEREFTVAEVPGILWTPPAATPSAPVPLILLGHPGGLPRMHPRLGARARHSAGLDSRQWPSSYLVRPTAYHRRARGGARRTAPGNPGWRAAARGRRRPPCPSAGPAGRAGMAGSPRRGSCSTRGPRAGRCLRRSHRNRRPTGPGRTTHRGRGSLRRDYIPTATIEEARRVTIPLHVLLQWDDHENDRQMALDLFDAFGSERRPCKRTWVGTPVFRRSLPKTPAASSSAT